jgi:hypothetical protein
MRMLTNETEPGASGDVPSDDCPAIGDLCPVALVKIDGSVNWLCYPDLDARMVHPDRCEQPSRGAVGSFDAAQQDHDDTLDQWLASITPDELACIFDGLADHNNCPFSTLEPTA